MKKNNCLLDIFTLFIVPIYTILLASKADWLATNLSVIGNYLDQQLAFLIWGTSIGLYFYLYVRHIFKLIRYNNNFVNLVLFSSCLLLFFTVATPYLPEKFPFKSFLHIVFAFISPLLLLLAISIFMIYLLKCNPKHFKSSGIYLIFITIISAALLHLVGYVSSLLEIFITISTGLFLRDLHKKIINYLTK